jgi:hypothetical protein
MFVVILCTESLRASRSHDPALFLYIGRRGKLQLECGKAAQNRGKSLRFSWPVQVLRFSKLKSGESCGNGNEVGNYVTRAAALAQELICDAVCKSFIFEREMTLQAIPHKAHLASTICLRMWMYSHYAGCPSNP